MKKIIDVIIKYVTIYVYLMNQYRIIRYSVALGFAGLMTFVVYQIMEDTRVQTSYTTDSRDAQSYYMKDIGELAVIDETGDRLDRSVTFLKPKTVKVSVETDYYNGGSVLVITIIK